MTLLRYRSESASNTEHDVFMFLDLKNGNFGRTVSRAVIGKDLNSE